MKVVIAFFISLAGLTAVFGQNEQAPIVEKEVAYADWSFRNARTSEFGSLRGLAAGKKLVVVVYFAPWCPNWRHDAPMIERLYEKYKASGLEVIGVSEYDTSPATRVNLDMLKVTFPVYYESEERGARATTTHYRYRQTTGDTRSWGSPWYIFLEPAKFEKGEVLVNKASIINGEMIEVDGEKFIREKLGLPADAQKQALLSKTAAEPCDPEKPTVTLKKP